jgi:ABC-type polysaccharide transport system permease subunit
MMQLEKNREAQLLPHQRTDSGDMRIFALLSLIVLGIGLVVGLFFYGKELLYGLKDFKVFAGLNNSEWIGLSNFLELWDYPSFATIIGNTLLFNLLFAVIVFVIAAVAGSALLALPAGVRQALVVLSLLPLFMPAEVYGSWWIHLLGSEMFMNETTMRFLHPALSALKYAGIPVIIIYVANYLYSRRDPWLPVKGAAIFALSSLALIGHGVFSLTYAFVNPLNMKTMESLDSFNWKIGMMQMQVGMTAASNIMQLLMSLVSFALLLFPIYVLYKTIFRGEKAVSPPADYAARAISLLSALAVFAVLYFLPYVTAGYELRIDDALKELPLVSSTIVFSLMCLAGAIVAVLIAAAMAGAFLSASKAIVWCATIMLALITLLTSQPLLFSKYLALRDAGLINTVFAIAVATSFSAAAAWALAAIWRAEARDGRLSVASIFSAIGGLLLIQTALNYGDLVPSLLYLTDVQRSPLLLFTQLLRGALALDGNGQLQAGGIGLYGFLISLPPLLLFAVAYMFLPKRQLLLLLAGGLKK